MFALVVSAHRAGQFEWKTFQELLVDEISHTEAIGKPRQYYLNWAMAAERLFELIGKIDRQGIDARVAMLRPDDKTVRLR